MSTLWRKAAVRGWEAVTIPEAGALDLDADGGRPGLRFLRFRDGSDSAVVLLTSRGLEVRVNGEIVPGGLRLLEHKDEILLRTTRLAFSAESKPVPVVFRLEDSARSPTCPICRGQIQDGEQAVRCPGCARWYHQIEALDGQQAKPCWTYAPTCRFDGHPTALTAEALWQPGREDDDA